MKPSEKLAELGLTLPNVAKPVGSYVPANRSGNLILTSGQLPSVDGVVTCIGKVGSDVTLEAAQAGAKEAMLNAIAAAADVAGGIDNIKRVVRVCAYVACVDSFTDQPKVANGGSDLLKSIWGDNGIHARSAVGVTSLPLGASVEMELVVETD